MLKPAAVLDPQSGQLTRGATVLVRRIEAVGPSVTPPAGARVIELGGLTLLPGLIDAHTHVLLQPEDEDWPHMQTQWTAHRHNIGKILA